MLMVVGAMISRANLVFRGKGIEESGTSPLLKQTANLTSSSTQNMFSLRVDIVRMLDIFTDTNFIQVMESTLVKRLTHPSKQESFNKLDTILLDMTFITLNE